VYRGTRPKASLSNSNLVYCDKCECRYSVLKQINADQWLNYHWAHFNCVQKKLIRQQEDNDDIPVAKFRESTTSRSDTTFVIEGVRQDTAFGREDMGSDEDSVDSATNFEIRLPVGDDDMDDETYDDYNSGFDGFFSTPMSAEDVGQSYHHASREAGVFSTIHLEQIAKSSTREIPSVDVASPVSTLFNMQLSIIQTLGVDNENDDFIIRSRFRRDDIKAKKHLADIVLLYEWGLRYIGII